VAGWSVYTAASPVTHALIWLCCLLFSTILLVVCVAGVQLLIIIFIGCTGWLVQPVLGFSCVVWEALIPAAPSALSTPDNHFHWLYRLAGSACAWLQLCGLGGSDPSSTPSNQQTCPGEQGRWLCRNNVCSVFTVIGDTLCEQPCSLCHTSQDSSVCPAHA
jgi:hypothetical protein